MKKKLRLNSHCELPLKEDGANLFLKIMIAVSVFLFALTLAGQMLIKKATDGWEKGISGTMTVQIKPSDKNLTLDEKELRVNKVIQFFEQVDEVEKVRKVSDKQMKRLMSPWLGKDVKLDVLPLPELLDVRLKPGKIPDLEKLNTALQEVAPYTSIDNHRIWLSRLLAFSGTLRGLSWAVLLLVLAGSAFSIFYATQTSLGIHSQIIEILHIIGATDDYIARQYAGRSFWNGLAAGILGIILAFAAMYIIAKSAMGLEAGILVTPSFSFGNWLAIFSIPLWTAVLSMLTAYVTVKKVLGKIM